MPNNQKLELTWIGKEKRPKLEPRILIEDPDKSYGDKRAENMLIFGDNLLALKALEQDYARSIKCIFIDPPYNTGSAFTHYEDGLEHSLWLTMMRDRLEILQRLLSEDGSIWITIDDNEAHYLKVLCDEVFGRGNFISNFIWQKSYGGGSKARWFVGLHEHVLCYAKDMSQLPDMWLPPDPEAVKKYYKYSDNKYAERGPYRLQPLATTSMDDRPNLRYPIILKDGREVWPEKQWQWSKDRVESAMSNDEIVITEKSSKLTVSYKQYLRDPSGEERRRKPVTIITGHYTQHGTYESMDLFGLEDKFSFPKPEGLIYTILESCTNTGDLVLDSFAGSGTTGAVAQKMGRKWIMVELGEHCHTHILPRMKKVCDGTDQGGISKAVNWQGGGGFKYYYMAPTLLKKDRYDQWVINPEYNAPMLAAAMAKHENFRYSPDEVHYWKQGQSSEKDFIFTTTVHLTPEHLDRIHEEMQSGESLLICCKSHFRGADGRYDNITVKKIPGMLLGKCEFDRNDYSLNIVDMPRNGDDAEFVPFGPVAVEVKKEKKKAKVKDAGQVSIFENEGE